jgi:hypothetical protein
MTRGRKSSGGGGRRSPAKGTPSAVISCALPPGFLVSDLHLFAREQHVMRAMIQIANINCRRLMIFAPLCGAFKSPQ